MSQVAVSKPMHRQRRLLGLAGLVLAILVSLTILGGLPPAAEIPAFAAGVGVLLAGVICFGIATWHLLFRRMPAGLKQVTSKSTSLKERRLLALMAAVGGINVVVGGFWDEVWHRKYGLPFGEDLFWRPHLLIYSSFVITVVLAFAGLWLLMRRGRGTLQQRFRSNPVVGMLVIAGAFLAFVTPADPIWHVIYGEDISAWSIPHILLLASSSVSMLLVAALQLSTLPSEPWQNIWRASGKDLIQYTLVIIPLALMAQISLQVLTTEWDATSPIIFERPEWLLPGLLVGYAVLIGSLGNHSTRLAGSATLIGATSVAIRLLLIQLFDFPEVKAYSWICALPPLIALDVIYVVSGKTRQGPPSWWAAAAAAAVSMTFLSVPLINEVYAYPSFDQSNLFPAAIAILLASLAAASIGQSVGDILSTARRQIVESEGRGRHAHLMPLIALVSTVSFIVYFVASAAPPA